MSERKVLAEMQGLGSVSLCDCVTVHLSVGAVTVRLAPEAFLQMMSMCRDAMNQMAIQMDGVPMPEASMVC